MFRISFNAQTGQGMGRKKLPNLAIGRVTTIPKRRPLHDWLCSPPLSVDEAESLLKEHPYQFKGLQREWESLKSMMVEGDELWLWSAPFAYGDHEIVEGYCIMWEGIIVATLALPQRTALDVITGLSHQAAGSWLRARATIDEVDKTLRDGGVAHQWLAMRQLMSEGDELWSFCSDADSWAHLAGRAGYALVREGQVIATIVTMLN